MTNICSGIAYDEQADRARYGAEAQAIKNAFGLPLQPGQFDTVHRLAEPASNALCVCDSNLADAKIEVWLSANPEIITPSQRQRALEFAQILVIAADVPQPVTPLDKGQLFQVQCDTRRRDDFESFRVFADAHEVFCAYTPDPNSDECVAVRCAADRFPHIAALIPHFFQVHTTY